MTDIVSKLAVAITVAAMTIGGPAASETVNVIHHGSVSLDSFDCPSLPPSSFVNRICYDEERAYLIVLLEDHYYHYCDVDPYTFAAWISAPSLGRFYNSEIRGGPFDCRVIGVPGEGR